MLPTLTRDATRAGTILGTAAYMSPEQAKGKRVDKRSDIWALGAVLFEMLTGKRAFEGENVAETLAFVLTKDADWSALPADTPPSVRLLLRRALEKNRNDRLADAADARLEMREALMAPDTDGDDRLPAPPITRWRQILPVFLAASILVGGVVGLIVWNATSSGRRDEEQIAVQSLDGGAHRFLAQGTSPRYSPTEHIVFLREGSLWAASFDLDRLEMRARRLRFSKVSGRGGVTSLSPGAARACTFPPAVRQRSVWSCSTGKAESWRFWASLVNSGIPSSRPTEAALPSDDTIRSWGTISG